MFIDYVSHKTYLEYFFEHLVTDRFNDTHKPALQHSLDCSTVEDYFKRSCLNDEGKLKSNCIEHKKEFC